MPRAGPRDARPRRGGGRSGERGAAAVAEFQAGGQRVAADSAGRAGLGLARAGREKLTLLRGGSIKQHRILGVKRHSFGYAVLSFCRPFSKG